VRCSVWNVDKMRNIDQAPEELISATLNGWNDLTIFSSFCQSFKTFAECYLEH
jgi:hypothetical protein